MHVRATLGSIGARLREKYLFFLNIKRKVTKSLYFTYEWVLPYPTDCNGSLHIC
jgi:hypothetical protein